MKFFPNFLFVFLFGILNAQIISIPYDDQDGFPIIKAKINNKIYNFLFDTGAAISLLNSNTFQNENVVESVKIGDISKTIKNIDLVISSISIDNLHFENLKVGYSDLGLMNKQLCSNNIDGVIGRDIMKNYSISINTNYKTISFYKKLDDLNLNSYQKIKLENFEEPKVVIKIGNQKRFVIIDTGSNKNLFVSDYKLDKFIKGNEHFTYLSKGSSVGLHGVVESLKKQYYLPNSTLKIGDKEFPNQQFFASDFDENNLGFGFLKQFNIVLDLQKKLLFLEKAKSQNEKIIDYSFNFVPNYDFEINQWVIEKINTTEARFKLGDILSEINGEKLPKIKNKCDDQMNQFVENHIKKGIKKYTIIRNDEKIIIENK